MADLRITALKLVSESFFAFVRTELQAGRLRVRRKETTVAAIPPGPSTDADCLPCTVHRNTAEAYLLLQGLADTQQTEGQIPPGTGGTVHLARSLLQEAETGATRIGAEHPELRGQAVALQGNIAALTPRLADEIKGEDTLAVAAQGQQTWRAAYGLTRSYFRQDTPATPEKTVQHDPLFQWMQRVREEDMDADTAMAELKRILNKDSEEVVSNA